MEVGSTYYNKESMTTVTILKDKTNGEFKVKFYFKDEKTRNYIARRVPHTYNDIYYCRKGFHFVRILPNIMLVTQTEFELWKREKAENPDFKFQYLKGTFEKLTEDV